MRSRTGTRSVDQVIQARTIQAARVAASVMPSKPKPLECGVILRSGAGAAQWREGQTECSGGTTSGRRRKRRAVIVDSFGPFPTTEADDERVHAEGSSEAARDPALVTTGAMRRCQESAEPRDRIPWNIRTTRRVMVLATRPSRYWSGPATLVMSRCRSSAVRGRHDEHGQAPSNSAVDSGSVRTSGW